ncbi:transposase [Deinococcus misasensis]|uniref:transposase n=1 Tax=Deinococcus misasensis TaxID=392413 RepID=UPI000552698B|nr:transposase [Deinococcus misasensis]
MTHFDSETLDRNQWDAMLLSIPQLSARDKRNFEAVLHVLLSGMAWEDFPEEEFGMSFRTPWNRYRHWQQTGLWPLMLQAYCSTLPEAMQHSWKARMFQAEEHRLRRSGSRKRAALEKA